MSERQGVEIDYCPQCRGVWLDRGELDKILDRAAADGAPAAPAAPADDARSPYRDDARPQFRDFGDAGANRPYRRKKKEHWLMDIFD